AGTTRVVGNLVYTTYTSNGFSDKTNGLQITDVSDPLNPHIRSQSTTASDANGLQVVGTLAYLANTYDGVQVFDVRDPAAPRQLGGYDTASAQDVQLVGDLVYVADQHGGFQILRVYPDLFPAAATITAGGGSLISRDGRVQLTFPADAVSATATVTYTGLITPSAPLDGNRRAVLAFTLDGQQATGQPLTQFAQPYTMVISYTSAQLAAAGASAASLNLAYWNGNAWVNLLPCAGCSIDSAQHRVTVMVNHFTEFVLHGSVAKQVFLPLVRH
ncbi:MAG: hypothetical protein ABIV47_17925, partial [Roseiflexaceae bacterium]